MSASVLLFASADRSPLRAPSGLRTHVRLTAELMRGVAMRSALSPPDAEFIVPATAAGAFGLFPAAAFRLTDGRCRDCATPAAALWYFERETIAVPRDDMPMAGFSR